APFKNVSTSSVGGSSGGRPPVVEAPPLPGNGVKPALPPMPPVAAPPDPGLLGREPTGALYSVLQAPPRPNRTPSVTQKRARLVIAPRSLAACARPAP